MKRPQYQRDFIKSFIDQHMGKFIAIHWRFDKRDWQHHCEIKAMGLIQFETFTPLLELLRSVAYTHVKV